MKTICRKHNNLERARYRCNQVLEAAAVCFATSGFHGASMAQISRQAGMSAGLIYNYFDSKSSIILAFVERESEHMAGLMRDLQSRDDPLQALLDGIEVQIQNALAPQSWHMPLEVFAEASRNPHIASRLRVHDDVARGHLRDLIKRGRTLRNLPVDDGLLDSRVDTIIAAFQGLSIRVLQRSDMDRQGMTAAFRVALHALLTN